MSTHGLRWPAGRLAATVLVGLFVATVSSAQEKAKDLDKVPKAVMDALKSKFPKPEITKWEKATEGGKVIYDIEFTYQGRKCEMDIQEDGTIVNIEREIAAKDLPKAVTTAVTKKFPKAKLTEIMEIKAGKEEKLDGYEIVLETADKMTVELTVAPDGKITAEEVLKKEEKK